MSSDPVVIVAAQRTPIGAFQGVLSGATAPQLGATAIAAAVANAGVEVAAIDQVLMGCVLPAGLGQAPARQAALLAGLPLGAACTTVNKMCGSAMATIMLGHDLLQAGSASVVVAGGLESMSNAPYLLPNARRGYRMGHQEAIDHMFYDGLQDPWEGLMMGHYADATAKKYGFSREQQDAFAAESVARAQAAVAAGTFAAEIAPVTVKSRKGETVVSSDETPGAVSIDKIPTLRPAFNPDGTVTAATSSSISDGAAATVLMTAAEAERRGLEPLARLVGHSSFAQEPAWFTTAPVAATSGLGPGPCRSVRNQRGVRRGRDGGDARRRHRSWQGQCQRRRLRHGPSDRRHRRTHHDDFAVCTARAWPDARYCVVMYRWRRSSRYRGRNVLATNFCG
jgi:acetyl-CoA C-acetyltransferase